jgi:NADH-quinone oxidoreductase subunit I
MIFGWGVLKGMGVTLKNFLTSYFKKPDEGGIFTVQYPEEREKIAENYRNFPFLVYDDTPEKIRCVACGICERECPPKCIHIEMETDAAVPIPFNFSKAEIGAVPATLDQKKIIAGAGKPARKPAVFDIDYGLCMNCGICEEVCPFDSIFMDHAFEVTAAKRQTGLVRHKKELLKSNGYFREIRPTLASAIDQKRKTAEEKKKASVPPPPPQSTGGQAQATTQAPQ